MNYKVEFANVIGSQIKNLTAKGIFILKEQVLTDCNKTAKWDTGVMKSNAFAYMQGSDAYVVWDTDYAKYAYYTGKPSHAGTELQWAEKAKGRYQKDWAHQLGKLLGIKV